MSEKKLILRILSGDETAVAEYCGVYRQRLLGWVRSKVAEFEDAEEIVQDTLMSGLDSLPRFRGSSSLYTWLVAIARHEVVDFYRRKKIKQVLFSKLPFLEKLVSEALGPELAYLELETKDKILTVLKNLSEGYREILRLKYIDGLSMRQIAKQLNQTVKAVESRLFRARLAFQKVYNEDTKDTKKKIKFFEEGGEDWSTFSD